MATRLETAWELLKSETTRGIEGRDVVNDAVQGTINAARTLVQSVLEIGPVIWHTAASTLGKKQDFEVVKRNGVLDGVQNAVGNTITALRNEKFFSALYTAVSEIFPDALVRDGMQGNTVRAVPHAV